MCRIIILNTQKLVVYSIFAHRGRYRLIFSGSNSCTMDRAPNLKFTVTKCLAKQIAFPSRYDEGAPSDLELSGFERKRNGKEQHMARLISLHYTCHFSSVNYTPQAKLGQLDWTGLYMVKFLNEEIIEARIFYVCLLVCFVQHPLLLKARV